MAENKNHKISIIIPCYNREMFLQEALESVLTQIDSNDEIIFIDDGSTDASVEIARDHSDKIQIITGPNRGVSAARNIGIRASKGAHLVFLDSDDVIPPGTINAYKEILPKDDESILLGSVEVINDLSQVINNPKYKLSMPGEFLFFNNFQLLSLWATNLAACIPKQLVLEAGLYNESLGFGEDYDLNSRMIDIGAKFKYIPYITYIVREHEQHRESNSYNEEKLEKLLHLFVVNSKKFERNFDDPEEALSKRRFARWIWATGRDAARLGYYKSAKKYFKVAFDLANTEAYNASFFVKILYRFFDPVNVEKIIERLKQLKRT